jgi:hypothetical protein
MSLDRFWFVDLSWITPYQPQVKLRLFLTPFTIKSTAYFLPPQDLPKTLSKANLDLFIEISIK